MQRCLRPRNGKPVVTDGPYSEATELVGGFFVIEAPSKKERLAASDGYAG